MEFVRAFRLAIQSIEVASSTRFQGNSLERSASLRAGLHGCRSRPISRKGSIPRRWLLFGVDVWLNDVDAGALLARAVCGLSYRKVPRYRCMPGSIITYGYLVGMHHRTPLQHQSKHTADRNALYQSE